MSDWKCDNCRALLQRFEEDIERITAKNTKLIAMLQENVYEKLVFKYIDRMSDVADSDPADKILREFVEEFNDVWVPAQINTGESR